MADGNGQPVPAYQRWRCPPADENWRKPLPPHSKQLAETWSREHRSQLDAPPVEEVREDITICFDPSPATHEDFRPRAGVGIEHIVSEHTLTQSGIYRPETVYPLISPDDVRLLSMRDPIRRARKKEQKRKRDRSRIVRNGDAPRLDPAVFPEGQRWAVERVNFIAMKRFSPPEGKVTSWAHRVTPVDLEIFHAIARHGGGHGKKKKFGPAHFVAFLVQEHPELRDAPTPTYEGEGFSLSRDSEEQETTTGANDEPTQSICQEHEDCTRL